MVSKKRILAVVLSATLVLGGAVSAGATVTSPTKGSVDGAVATDTNTTDHEDNVVVADVTDDNTAVVRKITAEGNSSHAKVVDISTAKNKSGKEVPVVAINANALNNKTGSKVLTVGISPVKSKTITVKAKAFNKSKVKVVKLTPATSKAKVKINKNAFKGTKQKTVTVKVKAKKASQITFQKGAFNGLNKKSVMKVSLSKTEFKKLQKKAKAAGFKGKIKRVS